MGRQTWRWGQIERERGEKKRRFPPSWLLAGCLLPIVFGILGYYFSGWFMRANAEKHWVPVPYQLMNPEFAAWLGDGLLVRIIISLVFVLLAYALLAVLYSVLFPYVPGEADVGPLRRRPPRRP